jgi:anti-sigma regulatory factor (Ser/Thr protein kinase)
VAARLRLELEAVPENVARVREAIAEYAAQVGVVDIWAVALAVSEAVTNSVIHAYRDATPGTVRVAAEHPPDDGLIVTVG